MFTRVQCEPAWILKEHAYSHRLLCEATLRVIFLQADLSACLLIASGLRARKLVPKQLILDQKVRESSFSPPTFCVFRSSATEES